MICKSNTITGLKKEVKRLLNRCVKYADTENIAYLSKVIIGLTENHTIVWYEKQRDNLEDILFHLIQ